MTEPGKQSELLGNEDSIIKRSDMAGCATAGAAIKSTPTYCLALRRLVNAWYHQLCTWPSARPVASAS
jgi:hypothetical protein